MTARDKLIVLLLDWHSEYCTSLSGGCDHFAKPSGILNDALAEHAHELAEKIRAARPGAYWREAADLIDPEADK